VSHPVGARQHLQGRQNIIMTEWGPWDHTSPLVRQVADTGDSVRYDLHKLPPGTDISVDGPHVTGQLSQPKDDAAPAVYTVSATEPGVHPYRLHVKADDWQQEVRGVLVSTLWDATFFKWTKDTDPRENVEAWRLLSQGRTAVHAEVKQLRFPYGYSGPSEQGISPAVTTARLGGDYFGMIAKTRLPLTAGTWEFRTLSDDGVRVTVDGQRIIDNWTWHGPTPNEGTLRLPQDKTVEIVVEHFEIDGYAVLEMSISPRDVVRPR
jgi:hypothetical protein